MTKAQEQAAAYTEDMKGEAPSDEKIGVVSVAANKQVRLEDELKALGEKAKVKKAELEIVKTKELPDAMKMAGVKGFTTTEGYSIIINTEYHPDRKQSMTPEALKWLRDKGHGSIIKRMVAVSFGKGQDKEASKLAKALQKQFPDNPCRDDVDLNYQTLKAFIKEQIEQGIKFPRELFGVWVSDVATIKRK